MGPSDSTCHSTRTHCSLSSPQLFVLLLANPEISKFSRTLPACRPIVHSASGSSNPGSASKASPELPLLSSRPCLSSCLHNCQPGLLSCLSSCPLPKEYPFPTLLPEYSHVAPACKVLELFLWGHHFSHVASKALGTTFLPPQDSVPAAISSYSLNVWRCFMSLSYSAFCLEYPLPNPTPTPGLQSASSPLRRAVVTTSCDCDTFLYQ